MKINSNNYKNFTYFILVLIAISAFFVYLFTNVLKRYGIDVPFYIEVPSIPSVYGMLFLLFDKHLWKWTIFKKIEIILADDLTGEWEGVTKSSYDNFVKKTPTVLKIQQTATDTTINGEFENSKSVSLNATFGKSFVDNSTALFYFYRSEPKYDAVKTMTMHEGSAKLIYDQKEESLTGSYYSGRDRNEYGTIKVFRKKIKKSWSGSHYLMTFFD